MSRSFSTGDQILNVIRPRRGCELNALPKECLGLARNYLFLALDGLSHDGVVRLKGKGLEKISCCL